MDGIRLRVRAFFCLVCVWCGCVGGSVREWGMSDESAHWSDRRGMADWRVWLVGAGKAE